jgi:hypothetical protein
MPTAKALKSFRGRYGLVRAGSTFNCEPGYFSQLKKKGWVELAKDQRDPAPDSKDKNPPAPADNRDKGGAPGRAGKGAAGSKPATATRTPRGGRKNTAAPPAAGKGSTSRSLRQDLPSQGTMLPPSDAGEKNPKNQDESAPPDA